MTHLVFPSRLTFLLCACVSIQLRPFCLCCGFLPSRRSGSLDVHARFRAKQKLAFPYDLFAGCQAFGDDRDAFVRAADRHRSNFDAFIFGLTTNTLLAVRTDLDRFRGNDDGIRLRRQRQCDVDKLARPKPSFLVSKLGFQFDRAR